ncbi:MAG: sigma-70 factor domain-containing protein, partial [Actinomycetota bacterium]
MSDNRGGEHADPLDVYLREISAVPDLDPAEEVGLAR